MSRTNLFGTAPIRSFGLPNDSAPHIPFCSDSDPVLDLSNKENDTLLAMESDQLPKTQWFTFSPPQKASHWKPSATSKMSSRSPRSRPRPVLAPLTADRENIEESNVEEEVPTLKLMRFAATPWVNFGCAKFYPKPSSNAAIRKTLHIYNSSERAETVHIEKLSGTNGFAVDQETFEVGPQETYALAFTWTPASIGNARENVTVKTNALRLKVILFATGTEKMGVKNMKVNIEIHTRNEDGSSAILTESYIKTQATDDVEAIEKTKRANAHAQQARPGRAQVFTSSRYSATAQTPTSNGPTSRLMSKALEMRTPSSGAANASAAPSTNGKRSSTTSISESAIKRRKLAESDLKTPSKVAQSKPNALESAVKGLFKKYASDSRWMEKQESAFKEWLNFVLKNEVGGGSSELAEDRSVTARATLAAKTKDAKAALTPKQLSLLKRKSSIKQAARLFFGGSESTRVLGKLKAEIEGRKLKIVDDQFIWADLGLRQHVTDLFIQNYGTHHLHLALETFFGEIIALGSSNGSDYSVGLAKFFVKRVLFDEEVAAKYEGRIKELYQPGFKAALDKVVLYRVLSLIWLLDRFKSQGLLEGNSFAGVTPGASPFGSSSSEDNINLACLFKSTSQTKSSGELLCQFAQQFLAAEGDILRRMSLIGYSLQHQQTYLDEFDFTVRSLSVDLRDGIRLARIAEVLSKRFDSQLPSILPTLRVPAISRLQKVHNVTQAMHRLRICGVSMTDADARELVDGKQSKTLSYLWQIIINAHLPHVVSVATLKRESERIACEKLIATITAEFKKQSLPALRSQGFTADSDPSACVFFNSELFSAILAWAQGICSSYGVSISNFTTSFSDGRALCYLVHYYAPELLEVSKVQQHTSTHLEEKLNAALEEGTSPDLDELPTSPGPIDGNWVGVYSPPSGSSSQLKAVLEAENHNFALFRSAISKLGFVPHMANAFDMSNTLPDEKVVVTLLAFLSARLIEFVSERAATITLQRAFRSWHASCAHVREGRAIVKIQAFVRGSQQRREFTELRQAAVVVQSLVRGKLARRAVEKLRAALVIQARWRMVLARRHYARLQQSALLVQSRWRSILAQRSFNKIQQSAITIQSAIRARQARQEVAKLESATLKIQTWWRMVSARRSYEAYQLEKRTNAAIAIQSWWRMKLAQQSFSQQSSAALAIQSWWRMVLARKEYARLDAASLKIQSRWRMVSAQRSFVKLQDAALVIQSAVRARNARIHVVRLRASVMIQAWWRMVLARKGFAQKEAAVLQIQSWWRMVLARKRFAEMEHAAIVIQRAVREHQARVQEAREQASLKIQSWWRMVLARKHFAELERSAIVLQSALRARHARIHAERIQASLKIQSWWRAVLARKRFAELEKAAVTLQSAIRARNARIYVNHTKAALKIQSWWRMLLVKKEVSRMASASLVIQSRWRSILAQRSFNKLQQSAITIQSAIRARQARQEVAKLESATLKIQTWWRMVSARRSYEAYQLEKRTNAAIVIQSWWRMKLAQKGFASKNASVLKIQSWWRMVLAKKEYARLGAAALAIQSRWRMVSAQRSFNKLQAAALVVQSGRRAVLARREFDALSQAALVIQSAVRARNARIYVNHTKAALKIQSWWRMLLVKKEVARMASASLVIQSRWRSILAQRSFNKLQQSAITIQSAIRARQARQEVAKLESATLKIQTWWRMVSARRSYEAYQLEKRTNAAIAIQSWWRMKLAQQSFSQQSSAALAIQSWWRMVLARKEYARNERAALAVQAGWRAKVATRRYKVQREAALRIQAYWRMLAARKEFAQLEDAAIKIQSAIRMKLVERRLRRDKEAAEKEALSVENAVLRIQALWKGYKARRDAKVAKIAQLRARIEHKRANTPISQTLGYRTNAALKTLLEAQKLSDIVSACQVLEESTMYSDQCARYVIEVEAIPVLFGVVATCNRSAPHISVLKIILNVVTYMCRWRETRSGLVAQQPDVLERLANVATAFKDVPEVFNRACAAFVAIAKPQPESAQEWLLSHASQATGASAPGSNASSSTSSSAKTAHSASSSAATKSSSTASVATSAAQSVKSTLARLAALEEHITKRLNMEKKAKKPANLLALTQESFNLISQIHTICKKASVIKKL